jgi:putative transposase
LAKVSLLDREPTSVPKVSPHRKTIRHFHQPGDVHELTFSCYRRLSILINNAWRAKLSSAIDQACQSVGCHLAAFVYMPEHVHLLVWGIQAKEDVSRLLEQLTVLDRGRMVFRYWQEGPGFDRNLFTVGVVQASINYIHNNPVKRGLCQNARDWRWSSARFYVEDGAFVDPLLPKITPLPAEFWAGP